MKRFNRRVLVLMLLFSMAGSASGNEAISSALPDRLASTTDSGFTTRVSVASDGTQGNGCSWDLSISADGRYVAFHSEASNLVPDDTNNAPDVFVHDHVTGHTERVSVASDGTPGNGYSAHPSISADGRYVAFYSQATNLVPGDTNEPPDIFVRDRVTGQTERVSVASDGTQGDSISEYPSISADGRYVAFMSAASNLVPGDTNESHDVFVHDRETSQTERVSVASDGTEGNSISEYPSISADGRYVAFNSWSTNLVPGDTTDSVDVFVRDRVTEQTERVSISSDGTQGDGYSGFSSISADGRYVAFQSLATNLVTGDTNDSYDVFVHDREIGQTERVSVASDGVQGNGPSGSPSISADGRHVAFASGATNLISGDTNSLLDIYAHDREAGQTRRVSVASDGSQANGDSWSPSMSNDGRHVAFRSIAGNLACSDTNASRDIFVHDREGNGESIISGSVTEANGTLVSGVTVSVSPIISDTTGVDGGYLLNVEPCQTYTVTPTMADNAFWPPYRVVSVPPAATGQDFAMVAQPVSAMLSPLAPGTLTYTDTQGLPTTLFFPAGAVEETTTVTLTPTVASGSTAFAFAGHAFDLEAFQDGFHQNGFAFNLPVTVTIEYSEIDVESVSEESELSLLWWTGSLWEETANTCDPPSVYVRDLDGRIISLPICHLSKFALFGPTHSVYLPLVLKGG